MADLVDLRAKISRRSAAALEAEHLATGVDKSELVRKIIDEWACRREEYCSLLIAALQGEGIEPPFGGGQGQGRA